MPSVEGLSKEETLEVRPKGGQRCLAHTTPGVLAPALHKAGHGDICL